MDAREKNNADLKRAWKRFLKTQNAGRLYACKKCDTSYWTQETEYTEACQRCGGEIEEIKL